MDCELPEVIPALTDVQLSWLRTAFSCVLTDENAADASERWRDRMHGPCRFLRDPFEEWRDVLHRVFLDSVFSEQGQAKETAQTGFQTAQKRQKEAEEEREKILQDALDLVTDQSRYENEIIDKPASREECKELLNTDQSAIAFRYERASGQHEGQHFIVFTDDSLLRLLKRVGMTKELYGPFKERALKAGVMVMKSASARFGSLSLNGFWFYDQKF